VWIATSTTDRRRPSCPTVMPRCPRPADCVGHRDDTSLCDRTHRTPPRPPLGQTTLLLQHAPALSHPASPPQVPARHRASSSTRQARPSLPAAAPWRTSCRSDPAKNAKLPKIRLQLPQLPTDRIDFASRLCHRRRGQRLRGQQCGRVDGHAAHRPLPGRLSHRRLSRGRPRPSECDARSGRCCLRLPDHAGPGPDAGRAPVAGAAGHRRKKLRSVSVRLLKGA
jgi:hypothetical protein